jgi:hypothetical protein
MARTLSFFSLLRALVIGNYTKVTYNQPTDRGNVVSLKRDTSLATIDRRIRDLYYTSDIPTSV